MVIFEIIMFHHILMEHPPLTVQGVVSFWWNADGHRWCEHTLSKRPSNLGACFWSSLMGLTSSNCFIWASLHMAKAVEPAEREVNEWQRWSDRKHSKKQETMFSREKGGAFLLKTSPSHSGGAFSPVKNCEWGMRIGRKNLRNLCCSWCWCRFHSARGAQLLPYDLCRQHSAELCCRDHPHN